MAKQGIHPDYHTITVQMTDGTKYQTRSTWGKEGDTFQLDVDPKTHPAWVGGVHMRKTGRLESFNARFGGISAINKGPDGQVTGGEQKAAAPKPEKKEAAPAAAKTEKKAAAPKAAAPKAAAPKAEKKEAKAE